MQGRRSWYKWPKCPLKPTGLPFIILQGPELTAHLEWCVGIHTAIIVSAKNKRCVCLVFPQTNQWCKLIVCISLCKDIYQIYTINNPSRCWRRDRNKRQYHRSFNFLTQNKRRGLKFQFELIKLHKWIRFVLDCTLPLSLLCLKPSVCVCMCVSACRNGILHALEIQTKTSWCITTTSPQTRDKWETNASQQSFVWTQHLCKTFHSNNAAALWSHHNRISIDLQIDYDFKKHWTARPYTPTLSPVTYPPPRPLFWASTLRAECPKALLWALLCSSWPWTSPSIVARHKFCLALMWSL